MLNKLSFDQHFRAVPYLRTSNFHVVMPTIQLSTSKPNVIVGPNGSGKSAVLNALSLLLLTNFVGLSSPDRRFADEHYTKDAFNAEDKATYFHKDLMYLPGMLFGGELNPSLYYRPQHIPGNEKQLTAAMLTGYSDEAHRYRALTRAQSSGQQARNLLDRCTDIIVGKQPLLELQQHAVKPMSDQRFLFERRREVIVQHFNEFENGSNIVVMDEPEQSMDFFAEAKFWKQIEEQRVRSVQIICATHSIWPVLRSPLYNIIETMPGYAQQIRSLYGKQ